MSCTCKNQRLGKGQAIARIRDRERRRLIKAWQIEKFKRDQKLQDDLDEADRLVAAHFPAIGCIPRAGKD